MSTLLLLSTIVCLWMKTRFHWKYFVNVNNLPSSLRIGKYINQQMIESNSVDPSFSIYLKFFTPFFTSEILDDGGSESNSLKQNVYLSVILFWILLVTFLVVEFLV